MSSTWAAGPSGVHRRAGGPSQGAAFVSAVAVIGVTALIAFLAAAVLLPGPAGDDTAIAALPTASPAATAPLRPGATDAPTTVASPTPLTRPTTAPASSAVPGRDPVSARITGTAPLQVDGRPAGRVSVQALRGVDAPGVSLPPDKRVLVATVRLTATERLAYDAALWQLEDSSGERWDPMPASPTDPLGRGTLAPDGVRTGMVAFIVPKGRTMRSVVLTDGAGTDLVVFARTVPSA